MTLRVKLSTTLGLAMVCALPGLAQERGNWHAVSKTAQAITGDVTFSNEKLMINFLGFPISQVRELKPDEILAAFDGANASGGVGHLYRLNIRGDQRFLHKNNLCGSENVQWMATYVSGKDLSIAMFSSATLPVFTPEAIANSTDLCGTYSYTR